MNIKKSPVGKTGSRVLVTALAALAFIGLLYFANHDRPIFHIKDTAGTEYEVGQVMGILSKDIVVDETTEGIWRGSMDLQVKILTGRYAGQSSYTTNYFSSLYNVRVTQWDKVSLRIDTNDRGEYQVSIYNYYRVPQIIGCLVTNKELF